ncbi:MAG: hypothetical protein KC587_17020 [Nitrospira sp.]|nr:hypothetical protein [Nitrospira sp.]
MKLTKLSLNRYILEIQGVEFELIDRDVVALAKTMAVNSHIPQMVQEMIAGGEIDPETGEPPPPVMCADCNHPMHPNTRGGRQGICWSCREKLEAIGKDEE